MYRKLPSSLVFGLRLAVELVQNPRLFPTAVRQAQRLVPRRWWASSPHLPVPRREYLEFRQVTLSGEADGLPEVGDVILWLDWCRSMHTLPART